jgi:dolichol-phosphate mannosyltransferase
MDDKLVIVIPAYNEFANISKLISLIVQIMPGARIIVIDDSNDLKTLNIIKDLNFPNVKIIKRHSKMGRGSAVLLGMLHFSTEKFDYLLEMDADFSHSPSEIPRMLSRIENEKGDMLIASRYLKNSKIIDWPISRRIFSKVANRLCGLVIKAGVSDYTNGFRMYSKRSVLLILKECGKIGDGFIILSEVITKLKLASFKILEIETIFRNRIRGESSLTIAEIKKALIGLIKIRNTLKD